jgi:NhaA family Na+:H+ antiporter
VTHRSAARTLPDLVTRFIRTEAASGIALVASAVLALAWSNSPLRSGYESFWHTRVLVEVGALRDDLDLHHFVNDGLMALFFFVVGLEIKREIVHGELSDRRVAALPVFAAVGGMAAPAVAYALIARGSLAGHGWGIPMATDIAFALGVLALLGSRVPASLKLFLLTLAIVDDIGAIIVIAAFYGGDLDLVALAAAFAGVALSVALRRLRVDWPPIYIALAVATWYATYHSGVHATIAGVALALTTPVRPLAPADTARRWAHHLSDDPSAGAARQMTIIARRSVSPAEHLEELLHPVSSFVVLPLFALANAGIQLRSGMLSGPGATEAALGVVVGLVLGKLVGIVAGAWIGVRLRIAVLPTTTRWSQIAGVAALGGIGFTVSLFMADLAFAEPAVGDAAKAAILAASVAAAILGVSLLLAGGLAARRVRRGLHSPGDRRSRRRSNRRPAAR